MNVNDIKFRIYGGLGHGPAYVRASHKSLLRAGWCTAFVVAILLASLGPRTFEQLDVFGKSSASFPRSIVDPRWSPGSDWNNSTDLNSLAPSRWYQSLSDLSWEPEPAFSEDDDGTNFNPSRWQTGTVDRNWYPKDGFKR